MMRVFGFFLVFVVCRINCSKFSIWFMGPDSSATFSELPLLAGSAPSAEQIADMICRLNGLPPLLIDEDVHMPHLHVLLGKHAPLIIEMSYADIPSGATHILNFESKEQVARTVSLKDVMDVLSSHDVVAEGKSMLNQDIRGLSISDRPVIILCREASPLAQRRRLTSVAIEPLTEFQISNYQITLWTAVFFSLLLCAGVCSVVDMEVIPDSLLFAKFQSSRTGDKVN